MLRMMYYKHLSLLNSYPDRDNIESHRTGRLLDRVYHEAVDLVGPDCLDLDDILYDDQGFLLKHLYAWGHSVLGRHELY